MKKILLIAMALGGSLFSNSQCDADYDFGSSPFGVSPDPLLGETFETAVVNEPFADVIHMIVPVNAGDVVDAFDGYEIDSLSLDNVLVTVDGVQMPIEDIGIDIICNNNGDSPNACTFLGGGQYCAAIEGVPTVAGDHPLTIQVTGYLTVLGDIVTPVQYEFDQYTFVVEGTNSINGVNVDIDKVGQNVPNPFTVTTTIEYELSNAGQPIFTVSNLLGDVVYTEKLNGFRGKNKINFDASEMESGIYLYSVESSLGKITKRMIVR